MSATISRALARFILLPMIAVVWTFLVSSVTAQETAPRFRRVGLDDGLSQAGAQCLLQDRAGFLWAGTQDGLNRYDGYTFKIFRNEAGNPGSLADNDVRAICEDRAGTLWVGTFANGLCRFDRNTETFRMYAANPNDPRALPGGSIRALFEDRAGTLWIGTNHGLCRYDAGADAFIRLDEKSAPPALVHGVVQAIAEDGAGGVWFGTETGGLHRWDRPADTYRSFVADTANPKAVPSNDILAVTVTRDGVWVGTEKGLGQYDPATQTFSAFRHDAADPRSLAGNTVRSIVADFAGRIWVATDGGLSRFNRAGGFDSFRSNPMQAESLSANDLQSLLVDRQGLLWVGAFGGGLCIYNPDIERFVTHRRDATRPDALCSDFVWSFAEDPTGSMWVGTDDGLARYDRVGERYRTYRHDANNPGSLSGNTVLAVLVDRTGTLWAGTRNEGLCRYDAKADAFKTYRADAKDPRAVSSNAIRGLFEDRAGNLWVCTRGGGICRYDRATDGFTTFRRPPGDPNSVVPDDVRTMCEDANGTLWLGSYSGGLVRFNPSTNEFKAYRSDPKNPGAISDNTIWALLVDRAGILWIGTSNGGLNRFDALTERFEAFRKPQGLPNDLVLGILEDAAGNLWISTNHGISRFDSSRRAFRNYDNADGLQSNEFCSGAAFRARDGEMFFGGVKGFNSFRPERVVDSTYVPPVVITGFRKFNQPATLDRAITETREIVVNWRDNFVTFEFASLCFTDPRKNRYAFKLEGFDADWIPAGTQRTATYTNLDGGTYVFRVKGSNGDGVWNEEGATIRLVVVPPPWKRWWAYLLYIVTAGGLLYGGFRFETTRVRARGRLREAQLRAEKAEVQTRAAESAREAAHAKADAAEAEKHAAEIAVKAAEAEREAAQAKAAAAEIEARAAAELAARNAELDRKVRELNRKNEELVASQKRADRIFSALAEALPGTVLDGKYRLEEKIGAGGFGAVFKATHLTLSRSIAVKVFKPSPGNDSADAVERFKLEGISASKLNHPNAISVLDFGISQEGIAFLAMELLQGRTLTRELKRRRLSQRRCAEIVISVCDALAEAHRMGIIHRDIKPDNIFLNFTAQGEVVKVVDFGIAKLTGADRTESNHQLTATGVIIGTPTYMAPERLKGEPYDGKTDVYSVGIVLYEMLAGRAPFPTRSQALTAIVAKLSRKPPLLTSFNPHVPLELEAIVLRALARRPEERPTAVEMGELLRDILPRLNSTEGSAAGSAHPLSTSDTEETLDPDDPTTHDEELATTDRTAIANPDELPTEVLGVTEEPTRTWAPDDMPTSSSKLDKLLVHDEDDADEDDGENEPTIQGTPPDFVA
jgi:ligand-binding sensor domain-containing protein/serine/threonine protein kinase